MGEVDGEFELLVGGRGGWLRRSGQGVEAQRQEGEGRGDGCDGESEHREFRFGLKRR